MDCAQAAIYVLRTCSSMQEILQRSVALKGDVDTVACIAGAIGSLSEGVAQDIPPPLYADLENGPYGRDYLISLDERLMAHFARQGRVDG